VRVDRRSNGEIASASSWNQIGMGDFHALDRMLTVVFADASGSIVPTPAPPTAGSSAGSGSGSASGPGSGSGSGSGSGR